MYVKFLEHIVVANAVFVCVSLDFILSVLLPSWMTKLSRYLWLKYANALGLQFGVLPVQPENIMCRSRTSHRIKIIDFGLAREIRPEKPVCVLCGTAEFISPEIVGYEPVGPQSDMWSIGVICYVLWVPAVFQSRRPCPLLTETFGNFFEFFSFNSTKHDLSLCYIRCYNEIHVATVHFSHFIEKTLSFQPFFTLFSFQWKCSQFSFSKQKLQYIVG